LAWASAQIIAHFHQGFAIPHVAVDNQNVVSDLPVIPLSAL
jgi:hypothetical protein